MRRQVGEHPPIDGRFNSRTPGGVRLYGAHRRHLLDGFNSRTPGGVRLSRLLDMLGYGFVSIHAPREGCDCSVMVLR